MEHQAGEHLGIPILSLQQGVYTDPDLTTVGYASPSLCLLKWSTLCLPRECSKGDLGTVLTLIVVQHSYLEVLPANLNEEAKRATDKLHY
jgi:hypothetical protein